MDKFLEVSLLEGESPEENGPLFKDIEIIPLETSDEILMAGCNKVEFFNDIFYVLDQQFSNLLAFNRQGNFLFRVGSLGNGPGQYQSINSFSLDKTNKSILIYSLNNQSVFHYDLNGDFIKRERIDFYGYDFSVTPNGDYIFNLRYNDNGEYSRHNVFVTNRKGKVKTQFFPYPKEATQVVLTRSGFMHVDGNTGYYMNAFSDTLYRFDPENEVSEALMSLKLGQKAWNGGYDFMRAFRDEFLEHNYISSIGYVHSDLLFIVYLESEVFRGQTKPGLTPKTAIVNLKSGRVINSESANEEFLLKYGLGVPKGEIKESGQFITSFGANSLDLIQRNYPETWKNTLSLYPKIYAKSEKLSEEDNPSLLIYKLEQ